MMITANFFGYSIKQNSIFDLNHGSNRDDCNEPYFMIRKYFGDQSVNLNTSDINHKKKSSFNIYLNHVNGKQYTNNDFLLLLEPQVTRPAHINHDEINTANTVFSWSKKRIENYNDTQIFLPNNLSFNHSKTFSERDIFLSMICANKSACGNFENELYSERHRIIKWCEMNLSTEFELYGHGWNKAWSASKKFHFPITMMSKILNLIGRKKSFPSFCGTIEKKSDILQRSKFSICFENEKQSDYYISEKIFDSFKSGCVPIYYGCSNINHFIPENCYIDYTAFNNDFELVNMLRNIGEYEFLNYQKNIREFLLSDNAKKFSNEYFAQIIVKTIMEKI